MVNSVRVIGVDPGTKTLDICGLKDGEVELDISYPSEVVASSPETIVAEIVKFQPDLMIGPSGMGLSLKHITELNEDDKFELTIERPEDRGRIPVLVGLQKMVQLLAEKKQNVYFIPGVIHLSTVPRYRKVNKIDLGTADKMAIGVLGVYSEAKRKNMSFDKVNFVLLEIGFGYNACLAVEGGKIVDGLGGTIFPGPAFLNFGVMDGEIAYLLGGFPKELLFSGGVSSITAGAVISPEEFVELINNGDGQAKLALDSFLEGIIRAVSQELTVTKANTVVLSGRLTRVLQLNKLITEAIRNKFDLEVTNLVGFAEAKEAAQGSALIADGLAGGRFATLVEHLEIRNSNARLLENVFIGELYKKEWK
ncbi:MAG: DUF1464 family protein [Candidatus Stahlbacteria bacterium]|nr:DUF1464 family protein [Candidatus Stahlbacteria bacterium]